jgi:hypothetical protein
MVFVSKDFSFNTVDASRSLLRCKAKAWRLFVPLYNTKHYHSFVFENTVASAGDGLVCLQLNGTHLTRSTVSYYSPIVRRNRDSSVV